MWLIVCGLKREGKSNMEDQEKAEAGKKYCESATVFNLANGGK